ncbi:MAG: right-handed parallel beta-helix repeat-containing protein [Chitinispirillia bacterium]|nr:right-handed parallel beta-helix repeat-containing protein [Chitinispirillia bacterium]
MTNNTEQKSDTEDPRNIWVCADSDGSDMGTYENPFSSISAALKKAAPGQNVILMPGIYDGDETIEISGTIKEPVHITASGTGEVIIERGCWYFYDTSDLVVSGLTFKNAPNGAIYVVGNCLRNRFHNINFIDCGSTDKASCTFYFGGSGARFNLVESCNFIRSNLNSADELSAKNVVVGLMVSDGDSDNPLTNHIIRRNNFCNYDKAVIFGAGTLPEFESGHIAEYNKIENCSFAGIAVTCGDVQIRGNLIAGCASAGIALARGGYSIVENNRVSASSLGITVNGAGHTVINNCFVRCQFAAVTACGVLGISEPAENLFIQNNTVINCGGADNGSGIIVELGASCIVQKNLFYGTAGICGCQGGKADSTDNPQVIMSDNLASHNSRQIDGVSIGDIAFSKFSDDNFQNESGYGAAGWVLSADTFDKQADEAIAEQDNYMDAYQFEDEDGEMIVPGDGELDDAFGKFFGEEM